MRSIWSAVLVLMVSHAAGPGTAPGPAQDAPQPAAEDRAPAVTRSDVEVAFRRPVHVAEGETAFTVVAVNHGARIDGVVREVLVVVNGSARIAGAVEQAVVAVNSDVVLDAGARVRDLTLYNSSLRRDPAAQVVGRIRESAGITIPWRLLWLFWVAVTFGMLAAGLLFVSVADLQLREAAGLIRARPGESIVSGLVLWIALPVLAFLAMITVIGIPIGLAVAAIAMPAVGLLGYLVACRAAGDAVLGGRTADGAPPSERPYLSVAVGVLLLQAVGAVPFIGGLVALLAGVMGAGALVYRVLLLRRRGPGPTAAAGGAEPA